jgi:DNA-binding transcriptional LysR family regulator
MSLRKLDIDDFLVMILIVNGSSVTNCGKLLCLTQPAISQRLRKIEEVFGTKLLDRSRKNAFLTVEAKCIADAMACSIELLAATLPDSLGDGWCDPLINYVLSEPSDRPASECN